MNVVSANSAFSACEVSGHESAHGTLKISHVNPAPIPASDENAAALSIDLQAGAAGGTAAQGIFLKSTTGGTSGKIVNYVDPTGATLFALLPDGSLLLPPLAAPALGDKRRAETLQRGRNPWRRGFHGNVHAPDLRTSDDFY